MSKQNLPRMTEKMAHIERLSMLDKMGLLDDITMFTMRTARGATPLGSILIRGTYKYDKVAEEQAERARRVKIYHDQISHDLEMNDEGTHIDYLPWKQS